MLDRLDGRSSGVGGPKLNIEPFDRTSAAFKGIKPVALNAFWIF